MKNRNDHIDVGSDLNVFWRNGEAVFSGYSYHTKEVVEERLRVEIARLTARAELLQEWLNDYSSAAGRSAE